MGESITNADQGPTAGRRMFLAAAGAFPMSASLSALPVPMADRAFAAGRIPARYRALYRELDGALAAAVTGLPAPTGGAPLWAANLLTANAHLGPRLFSPEHRAANDAYLSALHRLGARGVAIQISYPVLTAGYRDPAPYIDFFRRTVDRARALGMRVLVEHNVLTRQTMDVAGYYRRLDKRRFVRERAAEVRTILTRIGADYLSLVLEPETHDLSTGVRLTPGEWTGYAGRVAALVRQRAPRLRTALGAGAGTWESPALISGYARARHLDYVDMHLYPLRDGRRDHVATLMNRADRVRAISPGKRLVVSECGLYKAGAREIGTRPPYDWNVFARDVYDFWSPLDVRFLGLVDRLARAKRIEFVAPFWSRHLFAYLPFSARLERLSANRRMQAANRAAWRAVRRNGASATGIAFGRLARSR